MLYIHIPFCKSRCIYCNFFSSVSLNNKEKYINALCREIELRHKYLNTTKLSSIYFGGGTPSLLRKKDFDRIFGQIKRYFEITPQTEVTIECNPDDIDNDFLQTLRLFPFNRISIGIQTFDDEQLRFLNRRHNGTQAKESIRCLQASGFNNISADLIYSLPSQTIEQWSNDIDTLLSLDIQHISAYSLTYEEGTKLYSLLKNKQISPVSDDDSWLFFTTLRQKLAVAGFEHYEVSNFALSERHSQHNSGYWSGKHYLGIGTSAHSYNGASRSWNISNIPKYCHLIEQGKPFAEQEILSNTDKYNEFVFLSLRTARGIELNRLKSDFGASLADYCLKCADKYLKNNTLEIVANHLRLTEKGIFVSDGIMSDLMKS